MEQLTKNYLTFTVQYKGDGKYTVSYVDNTELTCIYSCPAGALTLDQVMAECDDGSKRLERRVAQAEEQEHAVNGRWIVLLEHLRKDLDPEYVEEETFLAIDELIDRLSD